MCYFDHIVMIKLQLGPWQSQRPLRAHEREHEYHVRLSAQKQAPNSGAAVNSARSGWQLMDWLRRSRVTRQPSEPG